MNSKKIITIPNTLSVLRLILIPIFITSYIKGDYFLAFLVFIISGITDCLDGFIARTFNQISDIGKVLDPLADKLTLISVLACLSFSNVIPIFIFLLILTKELFQIAGGIFLWKKKIVVYANIWGKITTFLFYVGISCTFIWPDKIYGSIVLGLAIVFAFIALINYITKNRKIYNTKKKEANS